MGISMVPQGSPHPCGFLSLDLLSMLGQLANQEGEREDVEDGELRRITGGEQEVIA